MNIKLKFLVLGFFAACIFGVVCILGFFLLFTSDNTMTYHEQILPSGKTIKVTMCNLVWGVEHSDRFPNQDCFAIEYVMSSPDPNQEAKDQEAMEVFELIRPISEQWKIDKAELLAFPTLKRKGTYYIYALERNPNGKWDYKWHSAKVHVND